GSPGGQPENGSAERLAGDTDGLLGVGAVDNDSVSPEVGPTRAEPGVSLPASWVDLLGEGLGAGVEGGVAAVDGPDGEPPRAREGAPEARLAVRIERHPRHHRA